MIKVDDMISSVVSVLGVLRSSEAVFHSVNFFCNGGEDQLTDCTDFTSTCNGLYLEGVLCEAGMYVACLNSMSTM